MLLVAVVVFLVAVKEEKAEEALPVLFKDLSAFHEGDLCNLDDGGIGRCSKLDNCWVAIDTIQRGGKPQICSYDHLQSIVCCPGVDESEVANGRSPPDDTMKNPLVKAKTHVESGTKSKEACDENYKILGSLRTGPNTLICPPYFYGYIIGGLRAKEKEFPHMAAVGFEEAGRVSWMCGGSLISSRYVLTAGHCVNSRHAGPAKWVRLGDRNLVSDVDDASAQQVRVVELIPHPDYKPPAYYNDIGLLKLDSDVSMTEFVRPACLSTSLSNIKYGQATGWGLTDWADFKGSSDLMKVGLSIQSSGNCLQGFQSLVGTRKLTHNFDNDTMLCAGVPEGGKDTCQGDSGGPYQLQPDGGTPCMYEIVGVTSFGNTVCGAQNSPAVYTKVSSFIPWIESVVWP